MDKKVTFHIDDIGSSVSCNRAAFDLLKNNVACSGSIMIPCKGFEDAISKYKAHPEFDLGIHLTLNSERRGDNPQWGPTLPISQANTLVTPDGKFYQSLDEVFENASYEDIKKELSNQIEIALRTGLRFSHLDAHMGVLLHKKLFGIYKELVELFSIPPFMSYPKEGDTLGNWFYGCKNHINDLVQKGYKCFDNFDAASPNEGQEPDRNHIINRINNIKDGTTYFLLHVLPSNIDYEDHTPDEKHRQSEYELMQSEEVQGMIDKKWIQKTKVVDILNDGK